MFSIRKYNVMVIYEKCEGCALICNPAHFSVDKINKPYKFQLSWIIKSQRVSVSTVYISYSCSNMHYTNYSK